jgi:DNA-binding NtrC family response regulator
MTDRPIVHKCSHLNGQFRFPAFRVLQFASTRFWKKMMGSSTILLVDDDIVVLAALSNLLRHFGYVVAGASNSKAAMDYITSGSSRFDLVITDLAMPGINGTEFVGAIKKTFPDIPVIVITGYAERCTVEEAQQFGAFAYLAKPLHTPQLISTIEQAMSASPKVAIRKP